MELFTNFLVGLIALEHFYIMYMEMFAWETLGKKTFKDALAEDLFTPTKGLAANQGLYNGFLASGLVWSFLIDDIIWANHIRLFFLGCIVVAGLYGAVRSSRKIFYSQALPAIITLVCVLLFL